MKRFKLACKNAFIIFSIISLVLPQGVAFASNEVQSDAEPVAAQSFCTATETRFVVPLTVGALRSNDERFAVRETADGTFMVLPGTWNISIEAEDYDDVETNETLFLQLFDADGNKLVETQKSTDTPGITKKIEQIATNVKLDTIAQKLFIRHGAYPSNEPNRFVPTCIAFDKVEEVIPNAAPAFVNLPTTQNATVGKEFSYEVLAADTDTQSLAFELVNAPQGMTLVKSGDKSAVVRYTPKASDANQTLRSEIRVSDGNQNVVSYIDLVVVAIPDQNRAPYFVVFPNDSAILEGSSYNARITAEDKDGDKMSLSLIEAPQGMSLVIDTEVVTPDRLMANLLWTPSAEDVNKNHVVRVRVSDGKLSDEKTLNLFVNAKTPPSDFCTKTDTRFVVPLTVGALRSNDERFAVRETADGTFMVLPGTWNISIEAEDYDDVETNETLFLQLFDADGNKLVETQKSTDTPGITKKIEQIATNVKLDTIAQKLFIRHGAYPSNEPNRFVPTCVAFDKVEETNPPTPTNYAPTFIKFPTNGNAVAGKRYMAQVVVEDKDGDLEDIELYSAPQGMELVIDTEVVTPTRTFATILWTPHIIEVGSTYDIVVRAADQKGAKTDKSFTLTVTEEVVPVNHAPVWEGVETVNSKVGDTVEFTLKVSDPDLDIYRVTHEVPVGAEVVMRNEGNVTFVDFSFKPTNAGTYSALFTANDGALSSDHKVEIRVSSVTPPTPTNYAPTFIKFPTNGNAVAGKRYMAQVVVEDKDGDLEDIELYSAPQGMELVIDTEVVTPTRTFATILWTPHIIEVGSTYDIIVRAADQKGAKTDKSFALTVTEEVTPVNHAPVIVDFRFPIVATATVAAAGNVTATDIDNDPITYSIENAPQGMTIDRYSGSINWTPAILQAFRIYTFTVKASDGRGGNAEKAHTVSVNLPDGTPGTESVCAPKSGRAILYFDEGAIVGNGTEAEATIGPLDFDLSRGAYKLGFASYSATDSGKNQQWFGKLFGASRPDTEIIKTANTPDIPKGETYLEGILQARLTVTEDIATIIARHSAFGVLADGTMSNSVEPVCLSFESVTDGNQPPVIEGPTSLTIKVGETLTQTYKVSDPNLDTLTVTSTLPVGMSVAQVSDTASTTLTLSWIPTTTGNYEAKLFASDYATTTEYSISILVNPADGGGTGSPFFTKKPGSKTVVAGDLYEDDADAEDPDGGAIVYSIETGPSGLTISSSTGTLSWQTSDSNVGAHDVVIKATDPEGKSVSHGFTITVNSKPTPPPVTPPSSGGGGGGGGGGGSMPSCLIRGDCNATTTVSQNLPPYFVDFNPPLTATSSWLYFYDVAAKDPEGAPLTYTLVDAPLGMGIINFTGFIHWIPKDADVRTEPYMVTVEVTDGVNAVRATYALTVVAGAKPATPPVPPKGDEGVVVKPNPTSTVIVEETVKPSLFASLIDAIGRFLKWILDHLCEIGFFLLLLLLILFFKKDRDQRIQRETLQQEIADLKKAQESQTGTKIEDESGQPLEIMPN